ncbi:MAG: YfhO family protein [Lachnospiraceae bacterium]|nr:YfhO family protein [Lachnospiraceae bacterium]
MTVRIKKSEIRYILKYTLCFLAVWGLSHIVLFINGKTILNFDDCISAYYEAEPFKRSVLMTLLKGKSAWTNFNLFGDFTLSALNGMDLFDLVWLFVPKRFAEPVYIFLTVFRTYLAGICASLLFRYKSVPKEYILPASMIYVLYGFILVNEVKQPVFSPMYIFLPVILLGLEKLMKEKKGLLFSLSLGLFFSLSVWETYFISLGMVMYFLMLMLEYKPDVKRFFGYFGRTVKYYLLGIGLGMPLGLPVVLELIGTPRFGTEGTEISVSVLQFFCELSGKISHMFLVDEDLLGVSTLLLFPILYLAVSKSKKKFYLYVLLLMILLMNMSIFSQIFGNTVASERGSFVFGIISAVLFANVLREMKEEITKKQILVMHIILVLFCAFSVFCLRKEGPAVIIVFASVMLVSTVLYDVLLFVKKEKIRQVCVYTILSASACATGFYAFTAGYDVKNKCLAYGAVNDTLETYPASASASVIAEDSSFYRMDESHYMEEQLCNLDYWYGYNGSGAFVPLLNPNSLEYCKVMESTSLIQINKSRSLGGKISEDTLACVKYYLWNRENRKEIPYGFELKRETDAADIYENPYGASMFLFFTDTVPRADFEMLNIAEKEEILLKKIVTEDETGVKKGELPDEKGKNFPAQKGELCSRELSYNVKKVTNAEKNADAYLIKKKDASILLEAEDSMINGELYVELTAVISDEKIHLIRVYNEDGYDDVSVGGEEYIRKNRQNTFCFNLGYYGELSGQDRIINIEIPSETGMVVSDIHVYGRDLSMYDEDVSKLRNLTVENIGIRWDNISADITAKEDGYLFFSIPYRREWFCSVDGKNADILKADIMYSAVPVEKGEHRIVLHYVPVPFFAGSGLGVFAAAILAVSCYAADKKEVKNVKERESYDAKREN